MAQPTATEQEIADVRARTQAIIEKAGRDEAFARQIKEDPVATLRSEGLPEKAISELAAQSTGDVAGYSIVSGDDCVFFTAYHPVAHVCGWYTI